MKKLLTALILLFTLTSLTFATTKPLPANEAFKLTATAKDYQTILLQWQIAPGYFLYQKQFDFHAIKPKHVFLGDPLMPSGDKPFKTMLGTFQVYANHLIIPVPIIDATQKNILLQVHYQGCSKNGYCYPPTNKVVSVNLSGNYMKWTQPLDIDVAPIQPVKQKTADTHFDPITKLLNGHSLWLILTGFLGFGILISLTPCVLPMIPILSSLIIGKKKMTHAHAFLLSLFYVLGMALTYAIAGVLFGFIGSSIQVAFQKTGIIVAFSLLFVLMAFSLFGFFQIQLPEKLRSKIADTSNHQKKGSYFGAFAMGVLSTLILSPCVTPPLVAVLGFISQTGNMLLGGSALFLMGIGMGFPLLLIGAFGSRVLPHTGPWMNTVKNMMGIMMLAVAIFMAQRVLPDMLSMLLWATLSISTGIYLTTSISHQSIGKLIKKILGFVFFALGILIINAAYQGQTNPLTIFEKHTKSTHTKMLRFKVVHSVKKTQAIINNAKPDEIVMLDFYANWCIACKELDDMTFSNPKVQRQLKDFILLRADITANSEMEKQLMTHYQVVAPPTILFFKNGKEIKSAKIAGFINAKALLTKLSSPNLNPE